MKMVEIPQHIFNRCRRIVSRNYSTKVAIQLPHTNHESGFVSATVMGGSDWTSIVSVRTPLLVSHIMRDLVF